jgi:hypothetical protein
MENRGALPGSSTADPLRDDFGASKHETGIPDAEMDPRFRRGLDEANSPITNRPDEADRNI